MFTAALNSSTPRVRANSMAYYRRYRAIKKEVNRWLSEAAEAANDVEQVDTAAVSSPSSSTSCDRNAVDTNRSVILSRKRSASPATSGNGDGEETNRKYIFICPIAIA